ncbi:MAG: RHS repeat domain-containing protein [Blastocatellia bacterium]
MPNYQATSDVLYFYDNVTNAKGKLTKVSSSVSTTEYAAFDILGRVTRSKQITDGVTYGDDANPMTYSYNLAGALIEQKYPSGRVVKNVLESDGDLSMVQSKKTANSGYFNYAKHFSYAASGAVTSLQLGNGRWELTQFNSRLQPTQIALGTVQNGTDKLDLDFGYGTTQNNGNVLSQTITVPTVGSHAGFVAVQTYTYDSLNRLKSADEKPFGWTECTTDPTKCWKQTFTFDRYGNRNFDEGNTTQPASFGDPEITNPTISTTNNRFSSGQGYSYDSSGNTTQDALGRTFVYDADNKQIEVIENNVTLGEYFYDGDGKRVKKVVPNGEAVIFVYDAAGKLLAEYANQISQTPKVGYLTNDHLGSPRINTDENGAVIARHDYHPFGEEIIGIGGRTVGLGYAADDVRKKFTSYERDIESELDFAQARMYNPKHGRFTAVDPLLASARTALPQSWNRYNYCWNNPLVLVDPDGMDVKILDDKAKERLLSTLSEADRKLVEKLSRSSFCRQKSLSFLL